MQRDLNMSQVFAIGRLVCRHDAKTFFRCPGYTLVQDARLVAKSTVSSAYGYSGIHDFYVIMHGDYRVYP
jgi:hypothetical protein